MMEEKIAGGWQISGPLMLFAALTAAFLLPLSWVPWDLFFMGAFGIYASACWVSRGCGAAFILLILMGIVAHSFFESNHLSRLGLEVSFALSFLITALSFESQYFKQTALESQIASRSRVIQNLEEEALQIREALVEQQIHFSSKLEGMEKNCEEAASDKFSLEILNDVLRKANARIEAEKNGLDHKIEEEKERLALAIESLEKLQEEINEWQKRDFVQENRLLLNELNAVRCDQEQKMLLLGGSVDYVHLKEQLVEAEARIDALLQVECLYKQLKGQFIEKNKILDEARKRLFKIETELDARKIKEEEQSFTSPNSAEIVQLDEEIKVLQNENIELEGLVTYLIHNFSFPSSFAIHRTPLPAGRPSLEETLREALTPKKKTKIKKSVKK